MSVFNVNQLGTNEETSIINSTIVMKNPSNDRLNELPAQIKSSTISSTTTTNTTTTTTATITLIGGNRLIENRNGGIDLCSDSEEDCERITRKVAVHECISSCDDVSTNVLIK